MIMKSFPLFSVIVPIYKVEKYLRQCLDSILSQTYENIEVILVDDGSPDNCLAICKEYEARDSRIIIIQKENGGLVSARKAGAAVAKGDYILNVDGDDYVADNLCEILSSVLLSCTPDIICFGAIYFSSKGKQERKVGIRTGVYQKEEIVNTIYPILFENDKGDYFSPSICFKAIRRELYLTCQLNVHDRLKIGEDLACTRPAIFLSDCIVVLEECLYYYRNNDESMTKIPKPLDLEGPKLVEESYRRLIDCSLYNFDEQISRNITHLLFNACVSQFNSCESVKKIKQDLVGTLNCNCYAHAINTSKFRYIKGKLAQWSLKYRKFEIMRIYSKVKRGLL